MKSLVSQSRKLIWKLGLIGCSPSVWGEGATPLSGSIRIFQQGHPQSQQGHPCFLCLRPRMPEEWASAEGLSGCPENCLCGVLSKLTIKAPNGQKPVSDFPCISQNTHSCAEHNELGVTWLAYNCQLPSSFRTLLKTPSILNTPADLPGLQSCGDEFLSPRVILRT